MVTILWRATLATELIEDNKHLFTDVDIIVETDKDKALENLDTVDILVDGNPPTELLEGKRLKHVIVPFVGIEPSLREALLKRPHITLHNSHYNAKLVAQHALALLFTCACRIVEADTALRHGDWTRRYSNFQSLYLPGKTCLLLGYGEIGKALNPLLSALGMKVIMLKRSQLGAEEKVFLPSQLHEALNQADAIICSLPETPETMNFLDRDAFSAMKPQSILVNVGRGNVIDQYALYDALKSEQLLAAGIDVWWNYPKDKDFLKYHS